MAKLSIAVLNCQGGTMCQAEGNDEIWVVHQGIYEPGDKIIFTTDEVPAYYVIRVDGAMATIPVLPPHEPFVSHPLSDFHCDRHYIDFPNHSYDISVIQPIRLHHQTSRNLQEYRV